MRKILAALFVLLLPVTAWAQGAIGSNSLGGGVPCYNGASCNLGTGALTINSAKLQVGNLFTQSYGTVPMQSQFWGYNAGAAYPITNDSGFGAVGIGAGALQYQTNAGQEDVAVGPLACQMGTNLRLTVCVGMHALGSELNSAGNTALGTDAMRDAISSGGYIVAVGEGAVANGAPATGSLGVGAAALGGNSTSVILSGTVTTGDVETLTLSSSVTGLTGLPLTATHTNVGGDTLATIAADLASQITQNVGGPSYKIGAAAQTMPDGTQAIWMVFPGNASTGWAITTTPSVTGAATESFSVYGGSAPVQSDCIGNKACYGQAMRAPSGLTVMGDQAVEYLTSSNGYISAFGAQAGQDLTTGYSDTLLGALVAPSATTAYYNTGAGFQSLYHLTTGNDNTAVGKNSCSALTSGGVNTCIGYQAGSATLATGQGNILISSGFNTVDTVSSSTSHEINIEGLLFYNASSLAAPAVSSCGTSPAIDSHANNRSGSVTAGSGTVTSCTITFSGSGYSSWNHCRVTSESALTSFAYSYTKTAITVTASSLTGANIDYDCDGY